MSFPDKKLTVRSSSDLATAVPYLLGFHPDDGSAVVIAMREHRIVFAARGDLPATDAAAQEFLDHAAHLAAVIHRQHHITDTVIIGYGPVDRIDPALRLYDEAFTASGITVRHLLCVTGTRITSLTCGDPTCCPPEGTPFDPTTSLVAVQATAAGQVALPNRAALAARITPVTGTARDAMHLATVEAAPRLITLLAAGNNVLEQAGTDAIRYALRQHDDGERLPDTDMAWLTLLLTQTPVRDAAVDLTEPEEHHITFWVDAVRRADEPLVPAPATVLALTAWRNGNGALALIAVERALQIDPNYPLADLLLQTLQAGLPPSTFDQA
ncbi:hypothetical protein B5D80_09410 [Micromonospora wenchangensis]|uniref:DUF4192 domain-containing protein n=1 Tax=Micromonospora wenchangensis TaxID=1185415 RepID=A0A246RRC3_9ACTN|nr:DUF4192 domain-containing protein [Micromonospora wenchangensis]OWV09594.1 hypothetical protein B5D80_09410 [Micromonospora wenchangensis]